MGKQIFTLTHPLNRKNQSSVFTLSQITIALSVEPLTVAAQSLSLSPVRFLSHRHCLTALSPVSYLSHRRCSIRTSHRCCSFSLSLSLSREFSVSLSGDFSIVKI